MFKLEIPEFYWTGRVFSSPLDDVVIPYPFSDDEEYIGMFVLGKFPQFGCAGHKHIVQSSNLNVVHWCTGTYGNTTGVGCRFTSNDYPNGAVATIPYMVIGNNYTIIGAVFEVGSGRVWFTEQEGDSFDYFNLDWSYLYGGNLKWSPTPAQLTITYPQIIKYIYFYNRPLEYSEVEDLFANPDAPPADGLVSWLDFSRMVDLVKGGAIGV